MPLVSRINIALNIVITETTIKSWEFTKSILTFIDLSNMCVCFLSGYDNAQFESSSEQSVRHNNASFPQLYVQRQRYVVSWLGSQSVIRRGHGTSTS